MKPIKLIILLLLSTLACGQTATLPTQTPPPPVKQAQPARIATVIQTNTAPAVVEVEVIADLLRVRLSPSTGAEEIAVLTKGQVIVVGEMVTNNHPDCGRWYAVPEFGGWVCYIYVRKNDN